MITDKVGGLVTMFHCECLDSSKMAFIYQVQNCKQVSQFCLDHSCARNGRESWKQLKQTCRTKQRKKGLKHKVSGYKSQSKRQSIAGCRLLLRTLQIHVKDYENCRKDNNNITQASTLDLKHSSDEYAIINPWTGVAQIFRKISFHQRYS